MNLSPPDARGPSHNEVLYQAGKSTCTKVLHPTADTASCGMQDAASLHHARAPLTHWQSLKECAVGEWINCFTCVGNHELRLGWRSYSRSECYPLPFFFSFFFFSYTRGMQKFSGHTDQTHAMVTTCATAAGAKPAPFPAVPPGNFQVQRTVLLQLSSLLGSCPRY